MVLVVLLLVVFLCVSCCIPYTVRYVSIAIRGLLFSWRNICGDTHYICRGGFLSTCKYNPWLFRYKYSVVRRRRPFLITYRFYNIFCLITILIYFLEKSKTKSMIINYLRVRQFGVKTFWFGEVSCCNLSINRRYLYRFQYLSPH